MIPAGIEPATFRFVAQHPNHAIFYNINTNETIKYYIIIYNTTA